MSRTVPWRTNCPQTVKDIMERLPSCQLLLVKRAGPTSFVLSGREGREKYRTSIGDPHHCSCSESTELCVHILFILNKVLFLPKENPLVWQRALVAAEIDELLKAEGSMRDAQRRVEGAGTAAPRQFEQGDICAICFEELGNDAPLSYCQGGCGKYLHARCFKQYMRHNSGGLLRCPYCRSLWINDPSATSKKCSGCKTYVNGECYRCLFCQDFFLCSNCFHCSGAHSKHPFSLLGARDIAERHNGHGAMSVHSIRDSPSHIPAEVIPLMYRDLDPEDYETLLHLDEGNNRRLLTMEQFMTLKRGYWSPSLGETSACNICLDQFHTNSACVWLLCGHFFHVSCAQTWLTEHSAVCPLDHHPVVVSSTLDSNAETPSSSLPTLRQHHQSEHHHHHHHRHRRHHHPLQRHRQDVGAATSMGARQITQQLRRPVVRQRVSPALSLPSLELQAVSMGLVRRRWNKPDRFFYGTS